MSNTLANQETLTNQQEHYCQLRAIEALSMVDAYRIAYNVTTSRKQTSYTDASQLEDNPKILRRIDEIKTTVLQATITPKVADIIERKESATDIMRDKNERTRDRIAANRLVGEYEKDFVQQVAVHEEKVSIELRAASMEELSAMLAKIREQQSDTEQTEGS